MKSQSLLRILVFILILASPGIRFPGGSLAAAAPVESLAPDAAALACGSDPALVGCWQMEEGGGASLVDGSTYGNNAAITGAPLWVTGRTGLGLSLSGTGQYAIAPDNANNSLDIGTNRITMSAWVRPTKIGFATQNILKKTLGTTTANGYELSLSSAGYVFARFNGNVNNRMDSTVQYPVNNSAWMHIAANYDGANIRIFINGQENATKAAVFTIGANATSLGIGVEPAATPINLFQGLMDDVRIYNRTLSAAEIKSLYLETYPGGFSCINLDSKAGSANTEHKPMSKVWFYEDKWWSVFPATTGVSESGSWLWRLDGTAWTPVLRLSATTSAKADVKPAGSPVGSVVHVLLYSGSSSELASVEYNAGVYQAWTSRPGLTTLSLPGSETATIDIDSSGRMWLNSQHDVTGSRDILVYYSDSPYSTWSSSITIATGTVNGDDISLVTALPNNTIGVLWSNQNTYRFGFKYHKDGDPASTWSAEEQPTSQYGYDVGIYGFADDHMNVATASDGTLYAAVKTGYDTGGYPKIVMIVRRLSGTSGAGVWDTNIYPVSDTGTRGIVLLDEAASTVSVFYTSTEGGGNILYKQTAIQPISFGSVQTMRSGTNNDVSSTKQNIDGALVAIYSNGTTINGSSCTSIPVGGVDLAITKTDGKTVAVPGDATSYTIVVSNNSAAAVLGATVADSFPAALTGVSWTCTPGAGSSCTGSGSGNINDSVNLAAGGSVTYSVSATIDPSAGYIVVNTATIAPPAGTSDPNLTNNEASDSTALRTGIDYCGSDANLVACYQLDEGGGNVYLDEVQNDVYNDGLAVNTPTWVTGKVGQALSFDGSQYGYAPDHSSLDIENQITLAAWIKPSVNGTQYLVKKGIRNTASGYELSLATATTSTGAFFFRINDNATCRVDSTIPYANYFGSWVHVAATYDHINLHIYVNGVQVDDALTPCAVNIISNSNVLAIGAQSDGTSNFTGAMDDVRVYNRALSAAEIEALFLQPTASSLVNLSAEPQPDSILVGWQTLQEVGLMGFDLYRAESRYGERVKINPQQIPAKNPGKMVGNDYEYVDATVEIGKTYFYWAEWIGLSSKTLVGPVTGSLLQNALWLPVVIR